MSMRAVAYLRVSQSDENIENQRMKILEFARRKGIEVVGFFADIDVSGTTPPRERPQYRAMLGFCRLNNIKTIIFYDLSRLARSVEEGLEELKNLAEEGFNFYFAGMDFLNYDIDPMLKKKIIMDFLWFAELYVEDIKRRTRVAMERLKNEGKLFHRPTLLHYVALYLSGKERFSELTKDDIASAKQYLRKWLKPYLELRVPLYRIHAVFQQHFAEMYRRFPKAPRSYNSLRRLLRAVVGSQITTP